MTRLWTFIKMKKIDYQKICRLTLVAAFDEFLLWFAKKYLYANWKLISLVYNINYNLIVLIDSASWRLYLQRCSYRWRNRHCNLKNKPWRQTSLPLAAASFYQNAEVRLRLLMQILGKIQVLMTVMKNVCFKQPHFPIE